MTTLQRLLRLIIVAVVVALGALALFQPRLPLPSWPEPELTPLTGPIDRILIDKSDRRLTVLREGVALRTYPAALGFSPVGDKDRQGDGRTPEGTFRIDRRNAASRFHLSLGLDYPQPEDVARARAGGYDPGGDIFIHGQPNGLRGMATLAGDWTAGCIALSNADMSEVWRITEGAEVTVEIRP
jgi:murein L,D-transpeptidase YafK